jgi:hypothetical protein
MRQSVFLSLLVIAGSFPSVAEAQTDWPVEFQIGGITGNAKRNISLSDSVTDRLSSSTNGIEAYVAPRAGGAAIGGRILTGSFGADKFKLREGRVFLGTNVFSLEGAYGERSLWGTDSTVLFIRAGLRSTIPIGGTGVSVRLTGSKYLRGDFSHGRSGNSAAPDGWEGESDLFYTAPRIPVFAQLGYRTEFFRYRARSESMNGLVFGAGLWLGGR